MYTGKDRFEGMEPTRQRLVFGSIDAKSPSEMWRFTQRRGDEFSASLQKKSLGRELKSVRDDAMHVMILTTPLVRLFTVTDNTSFVFPFFFCHIRRFSISSPLLRS